jgi:hypothetical protein
MRGRRAMKYGGGSSHQRVVRAQIDVIVGVEVFVVCHSISHPSVPQNIINRDPVWLLDKYLGKQILARVRNTFQACVVIVHCTVKPSSSTHEMQPIRVLCFSPFLPDLSQRS